MELKDIVKEHLVNEKEQQRLKKIEENSKLKKITLFTDDSPYCDTRKKYWDQEGISYVEKKQKKHPKKVQEAISVTNLGLFPIAYVNDIYLVSQRDFQNPQQLAQHITHVAKPDYKNPQSHLKTLEHTKTTQYHLWNKLNIIEQKLVPLVNFITTLQKEILEEDE